MTLRSIYLQILATNLHGVISCARVSSLFKWLLTDHKKTELMHFGRSYFIYYWLSLIAEMVSYEGFKLILTKQL